MGASGGPVRYISGDSMATNNRPLVSVIIPSCNHAHILPQTIESVLAQGYEPVETIIVDNGSTDATWETVTPYLSKVRYFFKEAGGEAGARNLGMAKARGGIIAFMRPGDAWKSDKIEKQARKLEGGEYSVCITDEEAVDGTGCLLYRSDIRRTICRDGYILKQYLRDMRTGYGSSLMVRREAVDETGNFDETPGASPDRDYFVRLASRFRVALVPEPLVRVTRRAGPACPRACADDRILLDRLARVAPEFVRRNHRLVQGLRSRVNRELADDLLGDRRLAEARRRARESLSQRFTFRALVLYARILFLEMLSGRNPQYRDRGCLDGR